MTPIEKNIVVVDQFGKEYESTWLKRAIGLVKKGRARWLNEHTICLVRPPIAMEESKMEIMNSSNAMLPGDVASKQESDDLKLNDLLRRIDDIRSEMSYLGSLLENWDGGECMGIGNAVEEREKTLRQMLGFLERLYTDRFAPATPKDKMAARESILEKMNEAIDNMSCKCVDGLNVAESIEPILRFYDVLLDKV